MSRCWRRQSGELLGLERSVLLPVAGVACASPGRTQRVTNSRGGHHWAATNATLVGACSGVP